MAFVLQPPRPSLGEWPRTAGRKQTSWELPNSQGRPQHTHLGRCFRRCLALPRPQSRGSTAPGIPVAPALGGGGDTRPPEPPHPARTAPAPPRIAMATIPLPA